MEKENRRLLVACCWFCRRPRQSQPATINSVATNNSPALSVPSVPPW